MRLVTWNCNGALRRKTEALDSLQADIAVIQECEDPARADYDYRAWAGNYLWHGDLKGRGIGIFARGKHQLEPLDWGNDNYKLFLAARVIGAIDVIGVWTQSAKPSGTAYIGQLWHYLMLNRERIGEQTILLGDFNSNTIWDRPRRMWNHSDCVRLLADAGLRSLYHEYFNEQHGEETRATYYQYRRPEMPYHIDYVFAHEARWDHSESRMTIGNAKYWLKLSDHLPIVVDLVPAEGLLVVAST